MSRSAAKFATGKIVAVMLAIGLAAGASQAVDPAQGKVDMATLTKGNTEFAVDLYGKLRDKPGNLFFSPFSVSAALGMTSAGAKGQTLTQMNNTMHFKLDQELLHPAFAAMMAQLNADKKGCHLSIANALWGQKGYGFANDFLSTTQTNYQAGLHEVDFQRATEQARKTINTWVEKQTQDKIKDLLPPGVLGSDTRLVLTNAIYFKGNWAEQFKKTLTNDQPWLGTSQKANVPLMVRKDRFRYLDAGTFAALDLPYVGKELSMTVFLPKKNDGLAEFEKSLTAATLTEWTQGIAKQPLREVEVYLPRFKMTSECSLKKELSAMGMTDAFGDAADFSRMTGGKEKLKIQDVIHKAFVEVNEEGTEAAAATGVIVKPLSVQVNPDPIFRADHPFFFVIRDNRSGSILFAGRLIQP